MASQVRAERLLLGLHGLALLRGWPLGNDASADEHIEAVRRILRDEPTPLDVTDVGAVEGYAAWSEHYDGWNPLIEAEEPAVGGFLQEIPPGRALDLACGTGRVASLLVELGHRVVGIEGSPEMLALAASKVAAASFVRADFHHIPLASESVDLVACNLALTHAPRLRPVVSEMARVLRPGGAAVLSDIHPVAVATGGHAFFPTGERSRILVRNELHWTAEYVGAFLDSGFEIRGCEEPVYESSFSDEAVDEEVGSALRGGVTGLPFALVWSLRKAT